MRFLQTAHADSPGSDAMALGVHEALRCPVDYQCADAVVFLEDPIYQLEPVYVTKDQVHTSKMVGSSLVSIVMKLSLTQMRRHTRLRPRRSSPKSPQ
jgi:hypothetical protein